MNPLRRTATVIGLMAALIGHAASADSVAMTSASSSLGQYDTYAAFPAKVVSARTVTVFVPAGPTPTDGYSVLYMHDGRNVFNSATAMGGEPWAADRAVVEGHHALIVVAIDNTPLRWPEYVPMNVMNALTPELAAAARGSEKAPLSDAYVDFIADELKPYIDTHYPTRPEAAHTFIAGSSMGGLISIYALERRPEIFSRAAGLSTHWPSTTNFTLFGRGPDSADPRLGELARQAADTLSDGLPEPASHRLWVDYGTETLDVYYEPYAKRFEARARQRGFGGSLVVKAFPGTAHNEASWRKRLPEVLGFLMD